jgi:cytosine/adenosine deaminase-related metal-dependent hydrolase
MEHAMKDADARMWANGIVAVGDISNSSISFPFKQNSRILYHTFLELIGFDPKNSQRIMQSGVDTLHDLHSRGLRGSLAPHSPYSTSSELIGLITDYDSKNGWPVSIHSQESSAETAFFKDGSGNINDIYDALKLDISYFSPPGHSSLRAIAPKLRRGPTLLVHNTVMNEDDLLSVKDKNVFFCLCPSANLYIENMLPDFSLFEKEAGRLCIGTDSLASNDSLDVVKEANLILKNTPAIKVEQLLSALTVNAARALNLEHLFGRLIPGKNTGLNLIAEHAGQLQFKQKLS